MNQLRWQCVAFYGWMFVFYNIERLHEPINLASFIYPLATAVALPLILVRWFHHRPAWTLLAALAPVVLAVKAALGYPLLGAALPLTVTELAAVALTVLLAHRIGRSLEDFFQAVATAACVRWTDRALPFTEGQAEIYREIRRARRFHRPLSLLTVSATGKSLQMSLNRLIDEVQQLTVRQYAMARIGDLLSAEMKDYDVITYRDGEFVVLLPETQRDQVSEISGRLADAAQQKLGVELKIGACSFPDDEVTFVELLQRAERQMESAPCLDPERETESGSPQHAELPEPTALPREEVSEAAGVAAPGEDTDAAPAWDRVDEIPWPASAVAPDGGREPVATRNGKAR